MHSSICVQTKRGPADAFVNLLQGSLKKIIQLLPPGGVSTYLPFLLKVEDKKAGPLIFSLLVLGFLKPQGKEEERKWNDVSILSFTSLTGAQCQPASKFKSRAKWLLALSSRHSPHPHPCPAWSSKQTWAVSREARECSATSPTKIHISWLPTPHQGSPVLVVCSLLQLYIGLQFAP